MQQNKQRRRDANAWRELLERFARADGAGSYLRTFSGTGFEVALNAMAQGGFAPIEVSGYIANRCDAADRCLMSDPGTRLG